MTNSKKKGSRGERELVNYLKEFGFDARRTQQYCGNTGDASDVVSKDFPEIHFEVKRTETLNAYKALEQATADAGKCDENKIPVVAHKANRGEWIAIISVEDLLLILSKSAYYAEE